MRALTLALLLTTLAILLGAPAGAAPWAEVGDAGDLPATAQIPNGLGSLDSITGVIFTSLDKDMYVIQITDPALFSATVLPAGTLLDPQLFLFDAAGVGVYGNDDDGDPFSTLPAGDALSPTVAGTYHLAISGFDNDPTDGIVEIFVDVKLGVQAPAILAPVAGWSPTFSVFGGSYEIALTGASFVGGEAVPVLQPWGMALLAAGLALAAGALVARVRAPR